MRTNLDHALRDLLTPEAARAPMPAQILDVPAAWVGSPKSRTALGQRLAVVATAALAALLVGLAVVRLTPSPQAGERVADPAAALAFFGVDPRLALETEDGIIAVQLGGGDPADVAVALITDTPDGYAWRTLATTSVPTFATTQMYVERRTLSCNASAGLSQPDLVFGFVRLPNDHTVLTVRPMLGTGALRGTWDAGSFGSWHAGFFMYALRPGHQPPAGGLQLAVFDGWEVSRPGAPSIEVVDRHLVTIPQTAFARHDACAGEVVFD